MIALFLTLTLTRWFSGEPADVRPRLHGPVLVLAGGGGDQTEAMQSAIDQIRGCSSCATKIDAVVIRASGADGYNSYIMNMDGVDSVSTLIITDRESAARPDVVQAVRNAELIFFAGGDQCNYIRWIKGTPIEDAVKAVFRRGGAIGGTSAGLAIQGEITYDACPDVSAHSATVMADPFHREVSLSRGFFDWPILRDIITDTHFQQRDSLGRLLVFMARSGEKKPVGIGVSERTVLLVGRDGVGRVMGDGPVHLVTGGTAEVLEPGKPLTYRDLKIWRFNKGETIDLKRLPKSGGKTIEVVEGKLTENPY